MYEIFNKAPICQAYIKINFLKNMQNTHDKMQICWAGNQIAWFQSCNIYLKTNKYTHWHMKLEEHTP